MEKIAFINGRYFDPHQKKLETRNFVLANGKVVGLGYLPDEPAEVKTIEIPRSVLLDPATARHLGDLAAVLQIEKESDDWLRILSDAWKTFEKRLGAHPKSISLMNLPSFLVIHAKTGAVQHSVIDGVLS